MAAIELLAKRQTLLLLLLSLLLLMPLLLLLLWLLHWLSCFYVRPESQQEVARTLAPTTGSFRQLSQMAVKRAAREHERARKLAMAMGARPGSSCKRTSYLKRWL